METFSWEQADRGLIQQMLFGVLSGFHKLQPPPQLCTDGGTCHRFTACALNVCCAVCGRPKPPLADDAARLVKAVKEILN